MKSCYRKKICNFPEITLWSTENPPPPYFDMYIVGKHPIILLLLIFQAKVLRLVIESGYNHFVGIYHVKVMGTLPGESSAPSTFSAGQLGIQQVEAHIDK